MLNEILHRDAITAADKLAVPANLTLADVTTGGTLLANTTYYANVAAASRFGPTTPATTQSQATAADANDTHGICCTVTQDTGAEYYDLFLSTDAHPKYVARITEAQRAVGGSIFAMGGPVVGSPAPGAGKINVYCVGTGLADNVAPFTVNNAYNLTGITPVDCQDRKTAKLLVKLAVDDLRSLPALSFCYWFKNRIGSGDWHFMGSDTVDLLEATAQPLQFCYDIDVQESQGLIVLVDSISGQGAAASVWVEL